MIIYRLFFGFCGVCLCFYTSMFMVPMRVLLFTLATPPVSFVRTHPLVLLQVFLHSGKLLSIPICTEVLCLYFTSKPPLYNFKFRTWTSSSVLSVLFIQNIISHFPSLHFKVSALPERLAVFLCFIKCPYCTETVIGVFMENLPLG